MPETAKITAADALLRTMERLPACFAYWDAAQRCVFANAAYRAVFAGATQVSGEVAGMPMTEMLGPAHASDLPVIHRVLAGEAHEYERRITRRDGTTIHSVVTYTPDIVDGRVVGFSAHEADVSVARTREAALARTSELLERTGALAKVGGAELDLRTGEAWWSNEMCRMLDVEPGQVPPADRWVDFFDPKDLPAYLAVGEEMRVHGTPVDFETPMVTATGRRIWVRIQSSAIMEDGNIVRLVSAHQEITDRKQAEVNLRESQAVNEGVLNRLRTVIETEPECVKLVGPDGSLLEMNAAGLAMLEVASLEDAQERSLTDFIEPAYREAFIGLHRRVMAGERGMLTFEITGLRGTRRWLETSAAPMRDADGKVTSLLGVTRDVTERLHAEEAKAKLELQLMQALKLESVGRLAGGVAHDFNNMLGVILGHTELALLGLGPSHRLTDDLEAIRAAAHRSAELTGQLLAFARKSTIAPTAVDLNETVTSSLKMLERLIGENIRVTWRPSPDPWPILMDPVQGMQILTNLCVNARDAIAGVGAIVITTANRTIDAEFCARHVDSTPGDYVQLTVRDDGRGMTSDVLEKIFEPFFSTKELSKGTGLGLATVYGAVRQNGGFITVSSSTDGGTSFDLYFPRHDAAPTSPRGAPERVRSASPRGKETILLVEDDTRLLALIVRMLEEDGYTVLGTSNAKDAIRIAERERGAIHLLLTDVVMPEMNGRDLASAIMASQPTAKRLFMSGYTADVIARHGVLEPGVHFLQKPFSHADLAAGVRSVLDSK